MGDIQVRGAGRLAGWQRDGLGLVATSAAAFRLITPGCSGPVATLACQLATQRSYHLCWQHSSCCAVQAHVPAADVNADGRPNPQPTYPPTPINQPPSLLCCAGPGVRGGRQR